MLALFSVVLLRLTLETSEYLAPFCPEIISVSQQHRCRYHPQRNGLLLKIISATSITRSYAKALSPQLGLGQAHLLARGIW